ncbi:MAG: OsmC family protein [Acidobacteria bacterium]|nr:OsmC family protein [Acidobacteriota bacterium]
MPAPNVETVVELVWDGELRLAGSTPDGAAMMLDSGSRAGPSPMQALAYGLAGCMAMDVVDILKKGRHDLTGLSTRLTGRRSPEPPKRFLEIDLHFTIRGDVPDAPIGRAIDLSRQKYCSVWHSLRQDIVFRTTYDRESKG